MFDLEVIKQILNISDDIFNTFSWSEFDIEGNMYLQGKSDKMFLIINSKNEIVEQKGIDIL